MSKVAKSELRDAERQLARFTNSFDRNLAALQTSRSGILDLKRSTTELSQAQETAQSSLASTTAEMERQERTARALNAIHRVQPGPSGKSAADSASVFVQGGLTTIEHDIEAADRLRGNLNPLVVIQSTFNAELARYRDLAAKGRITTEELAQAEAHLGREMESATAATKRAGGGSGAFRSSILGLQPYELQNLSYQVNDVVTQLASGTSLSRTLGQQGGQILQIFPRVSSAIFSAFANPAFLGAAAVAGAIGLALNRAADQADRLRNATSDLGRRANGGDYRPGGIAEQERQLQRLGATSDEARKALGAFIDVGVPAQSLAQFGRIAKETSEVLGTDLPTAAQQVATAFTGGYQAIAELDNRLNFLTATQREHIRQLFEEGRAEEARSTALGIYTGKMDAAAQAARGPWATANRELSKSWNDLLSRFADTEAIQAATKFINSLASAVDGLGRSIEALNTRGASTQTEADAAEAAAITAALKNPKTSRNQLYLRNEGTGQPYTDDELKQRLAKLQPAAAPASPSGSAAKTTQGDTPQARERRDRIVAINDEEELQKLRDAGQQRLLTAAEKTRREQLAGAIGFRQEQDAALGAIRRQAASAHETAAIQKETKTQQDRVRAEARQAQAERENTIKRYLQRIGAAEGGAGPNRAGSSAFGIGQFTRGTFVDTYRRSNPGTALNNDQIADLRRNLAVAQQILDVFTRQNAQFLTNLHQTISGANLYLIHFLGQGTGGAALRAPGGTPIDQIIRRSDPHPEQVLAQNRGYLFDKDKGRYRTRAELQSFLGNRVGDAAGIGGEDRGAAVVALQSNEARMIEATRKKQEELDLSIRQGNEDRQRGIAALHEQEGKYGTDLIDVQRVEAGANAVEELRQRVEAINRAREEGSALITVTPEQVEEVRKLASAYFDAQHARDRLTAQHDNVQRPISDLQEQKALLQQQAEFLRSIGDNDGAEKIEQQIRGMSGAIGEAIDRAIAFYQSFDEAQRVSLGILDDQQLRNIIDRLEQAKQASHEWGRVAGLSAKDVAQAFAGAAVNAFTNFINKVSAGKNVFRSFIDGIREFAAAFLQAIAQMILQLLAYAAVVTILRALGVPIPSGGFGGGGGGGLVHEASHHTGGIVGQGSGQRRAVSPMLFAGAMRYHTGGIVGLLPNEQAIIAKKGEEVLTESDPRHRNNSGSAAANDRGATPTPVNIINAFDREEAAEMLLRTRAGERTILNYISNNSGAVKAALR